VERLRPDRSNLPVAIAGSCKHRRARDIRRRFLRGQAGIYLLCA